MKLADFLSPTFHFLSEAENATEAFKLLKRRGLQSEIDFYIECSDYTSWIKEDGKELMLLLLADFESAELPGESKKALLQSTQKNYPLFQDELPLNLNFWVQGEIVPVHRILFAIASPFFVKRMSQDHEKPYVTLQLSKKAFDYFREFIYTGTIHLLVKEEPEFILELTRHALKIEMEPLAQFAGGTYKRYINKDNLLATLKMARLENLHPIEEACLDKINESGMGIELTQLLGGGFHARIDSIGEELEELLRQIGKEILSVKANDLSPEILKLPKLAELDLSNTHTLTVDLLQELSSSIVRLKLSDCDWLNDDLFLAIVQRLPKLSLLDLSKNLSLTFRSFTALQRLHRLTSLDISNCRQIGNDEMQLVIESAPKLTHLYADELALSDEALAALKKLSGLQLLSLRNLNGVEGEGLMELLDAFPYLEKLDLTGARGLQSLYIDKAKKKLPIIQ